MITDDMLSAYEDYREAVHRLNQPHQTVKARSEAIAVRDGFEAHIREGYLDPVFYGAVLPLSIASIRETGRMLSAALRTPEGEK